MCVCVCVCVWSLKGNNSYNMCCIDGDILTCILLERCWCHWVACAHPELSLLCCSTVHPRILRVFHSNQQVHAWERERKNRIKIQFGCCCYFLLLLLLYMILSRLATQDLFIKFLLASDLWSYCTDTSSMQLNDKTIWHDTIKTIIGFNLSKN